jgi:hypothetical protein
VVHEPTRVEQANIRQANICSTPYLVTVVSYDRKVFTKSSPDSFNLVPARTEFETK